MSFLGFSTTQWSLASLDLTFGSVIIEHTFMDVQAIDFGSIVNTTYLCCMYWLQ